MSEDVALDLSAVREYQAARDEVTRRTEALDAAKKVLDRAEQRVLRLYESHGASSVRCDGRLVYLERKVYVRPRPGDEAELLAALDAEGHGDVIAHKVNPSTLSALYREHERDGDPLPESVTAHVEVSEVFGVRMRRA